MDQKCVLCGADLVWSQEEQKYSCSDQCINITSANDSGLPEPFRKHYRFLLRTVEKLRRDVSTLKEINREVFDAYASTLVGSQEENGDKESQDKSSTRS